jgi:hypothetical protein
MRRRRRLVGPALLLLPLVPVLGCAENLIVEVATPSGERVRDRQAVEAALQAVRPGGTVVFAAGEYLVGGGALESTTPDVTLRGHAAGTTLTGCSEAERQLIDREDFYLECGDGLVLTGRAQRVLDLRFRSFSTALAIEHGAGAPPFESVGVPSGGHRVEGSTFEDLTSGVVVNLDADSTVTIRNNVFRNTWHAASLEGRKILFVENDISVPDPSRAPRGYPGGAVGIAPPLDREGACESMSVERNRISGHTEAVMVALFPPTRSDAVETPTSSCSDITIRDNVIVMRPVYVPLDGSGGTPDSDTAQPLAIAPAIRLLNFQKLASDGMPIWVQALIPEQGWPAAFADARISDVLIEGNQISGAVGVAIEVVGASDTRIQANTIEVRPARTAAEIEGLERGGNAQAGVWVDLGLMQEVNGSPVWVSPGSSGVVVR